LSRPVTALIELIGEILEIERAHARIGKEAERIAQAMWHQRESDRDAKQRVRQG